MGVNQPEQKAAGSGVTTQRSFLPDDIVDSSQDAFRDSLGNTLQSTGNMSGISLDRFNPTALNLSNANAYSFSPLFSDQLDTVVGGQYSKALQDDQASVNAVNSNIARTLSNNPSNSALVASLQAENNLNNSLNSGQRRLQALTQQREYDVAQRNAEQAEAAYELQRISQNNQNQLAQRSAAENVFQLNNQAALNEFNTQAQAAQLQQDLFRSLGQGLIATAPQLQGNFTIDDLKELQNNPDLLDPRIFGGGGILSDDQINQMTGSNANPPQNSGRFNPYQGTNIVGRVDRDTVILDDGAIVNEKLYNRYFT